MTAGRPIIGNLEGSLKPRYPVPELEKRAANQLKDARVQVKKIEKDVNQVFKLCIEKQRMLNDDYENLLNGKDGLSAKDLTKIAQELRSKEVELRDHEMDLALLSKDKKSTDIGFKILQTKLKLKTVFAKQELLTNLKSGDSVVPEAFTLRATLINHLEKISKNSNGYVISNEFAQAIERYFEIGHMTIKSGLSPEHKGLINKELKILRLKLRALAKTSLEVSRKDIKLLASLPHSKKITNREAEKGQEVLIKLALAELCFPSLSSANISPPDSRKEIIKRFMTEFTINPESQLTKKLLTSNVEILKKLYEVVVPYSKPKINFSLEIDEAFSRIQAVETPLVFDHKITSSEKQWTKISTGIIFGGTKHPELKMVAKKVEYLGNQCILAMKYLDDQAIKVSIGEVRSAKELGQGINELGKRLDDIERQLESLRSVVATYGYDKVGTKIEIVIARQTNVLKGLRSKKGALQNFAHDNYIEAVKGYKQVLVNVQEARKNKYESGRLMFEAQTIVEKLKTNPGLAGPNNVVKNEIGLMIEKAEMAINAARSDGVIALTKDETRLRNRLLKAYLAKDFPKLKIEKHVVELRSLLAKEITNVLFFIPQGKRDAKVVQMLTLINLLNKNDQGDALLKRALTAPGMQDIINRFNQDLTNPQLIIGVASRNNIRRLLIKTADAVHAHSSEKDEVGKNVFQAMEHLNEIERAFQACDDAHQKNVLGRIHENTSRLIDHGKPFLELTSDKTKMFAAMLAGKFTTRHDGRRVDAMLSKAITRFFYFTEPADKRAREDEIATVIANIRALKPKLYSELMADASLKKIIDKFLVQLKPGRIEFESFAMEVNKDLALAKAAKKKDAVFHIFNAIESHRKASVVAVQIEDAGAVIRCRKMLEKIVSKAKYLKLPSTQSALVEKLSDETYRRKANILEVKRILAKILVLTLINTQARRDEAFQDVVGTMLKNIQAAQPAQYQELMNDPNLQGILKTIQDEKTLVSASTKSFAAIEDFIRFAKQIAGATDKTSQKQLDEWKKNLADKEDEFADIIVELTPLTNIRPGSESQMGVIVNLEALKLILASPTRTEKLELAMEWYELNKPMQFILQGVVSTYTDLFGGDPIFLEAINPQRIVVGHQIMARRDPENKEKLETLINLVKEFSISITQVAPILGKPGTYEGSRGLDTLKLKDNLTMTAEREQAIHKLRSEVARIKEAADKIEFSTSEIGKIADISKKSLLDNLVKTERQLNELEKVIRGEASVKRKIA
jgi:hypothetical protein